MSKFVFESEVLKISCEYGFHLLESVSAIGKSYALKIMREFDRPNLFKTCSSRSDYDDFYSSVDSLKSGMLLFLDRCDIFLTDEMLQYVEDRQDIVILADLKDPFRSFKFLGNGFRVPVSCIEAGEVVITDDVDYGRQWRSEHIYPFI